MCIMMPLSKRYLRSANAKIRWMQNCTLYIHTSKKHNWNVLYLWRLELRILFQLSCSWCKIVCKKLMSPILQNLQIERFSHDAITSFEWKMPLKVFDKKTNFPLVSKLSYHYPHHTLKKIYWSQYGFAMNCGEVEVLRFVYLSTPAFFHWTRLL